MKKKKIDIVSLFMSIISFCVVGSIVTCMIMITSLPLTQEVINTLVLINTEGIFLLIALYYIDIGANNLEKAFKDYKKRK